MAFLAPRLQRFALSTSVPLSLVSLAVGSLGDRVAADRRHLRGRVRPRRAGQRSDRRLPERRRAAGRVRSGKPGPAMDARVLRAGRHHRCRGRGPHADGRTSTSASGSLFAGVALAVTRWSRQRCCRRERRRGAVETSFSITALFRNPSLVGPRARGAVRVPGRGVDGHLVGPLPARRARRVAAGVAAHGVHRVLRGVPVRAAVRRPGAVRARAPRHDPGRRLSAPPLGGTIAALTDSPPVVGVRLPGAGVHARRGGARPGSAWSTCPTRSRRTRSRPSPPSATPGSSGARRSSAGWPTRFSLRASVSVIVIATLGIIVGGLLAPKVVVTALSASPIRRLLRQVDVDVLRLQVVVRPRRGPAHGRSPTACTRPTASRWARAACR